MEKEKRKPVKVAREAATTFRCFKLVIAYVGTNYSGWQKQKGRVDEPTVQEMLEIGARRILRTEKISFHGSGRTDAGVHARGQVAHLRAEVDFPAATLLKALNAHLPFDVRIVSLTETEENFHAQLSVKTKTYRYFLLNTVAGKDPVQWPFLRPYSWFLPYPLDLEKMRAALAQLEGVHDFKSFQNSGTPIKDTTREILEARLIEHQMDSDETPPWMPGPGFPAHLLEIRVRGTGFLKQMVRNLVGTVVDIGRGHTPLEDLEKILKSKNRSASGMTAPAHGLFLDQVEY